MKTILTAISALALATPALAQMTSVPSATTPEADSSAAVAQPTTAATPTDPKAIIASEFPTYDKDGNNMLSRGEFDAWMVALKEKSGAPAMKPAESTAWLKGAFSSADKDKSKAVSMAELTAYLTQAG